MVSAGCACCSAWQRPDLPPPWRSSRIELPGGFGQHDDGHETVVFAAQLGTLPSIGSGLVDPGPGIR